MHVNTVKAGEVVMKIEGSTIIGATSIGPTVRVPWSQQNCEALADMRAPHIPPMVAAYHWPAPWLPFPHQFRLSGFLSTHKRGFCLAQMGTGKTISSIWAVDYLRSVGAIKRVLVVCPKSLMVGTWAKELIGSVVPTGTTYMVLNGDAARRKTRAQTYADYHIINPDGLEIVYEELLANNYDVVIVDESTNFKNINRRWKFLNAIVAKVPRLWLMTGAPTPQSPMDAYGQIKLVRGAEWTMSEGAFKNLVMKQDGPFKWTQRPEAPAIIQELMQPAVFVKKRDVLKDLPPIMDTFVEVELTTEQKAMLKELRKDQLTIQGAHTITAVHGAALRLKLIQIASGIVYTDTREEMQIPSAPRFNELLRIFEEVRERDSGERMPNNKLLIFCAFVSTANMLHQQLSAAGKKVALISGAVSQGKRDAVFTGFNTTREYDAIVAVPDTMSHGLTLTAASTIVWYTPIDKADTYQQACGRIDRPGQLHSMEVVHLYASAAERKLYENQKDMQTGQQGILAGYSELVNLIQEN